MLSVKTYQDISKVERNLKRCVGWIRLNPVLSCVSLVPESSLTSASPQRYWRFESKLWFGNLLSLVRSKPGVLWPNTLSALMTNSPGVIAVKSLFHFISFILCRHISTQHVPDRNVWFTIPEHVLVRWRIVSSAISLITVTTKANQQSVVLPYPS